MFKLNLKQNKRHILHIDADAFFASVEQVLNPTLKGKPLIVGGPTKTSGIVSAASYEAKKFGIYSGMPMYLAKKKCPSAVVVGGHFDVYRRFSKEMYRIFMKYTPDVEMTSIDEAYLDITGCEKMHGHSARLIAKSILMNVYKKLGISVSCGAASSKIVAKVASSTNKPHKLTLVPFGKEERFLAPLSLRALPGVGPKTFLGLERNGFNKVGDVSRLGLSEVLDRFSLDGLLLWKKCRGIDNSPVVSASPLPKSISKERTFYAPVTNVKVCLKVLKKLSAHVFEKLRRHEMKARTIVVKIRYKDISGGHVFKDFSFQRHLGVLSSADRDLFPVVKKLFLENFADAENVRLLGIGVSNLVRNYNLNLFGEGEKNDDLFSTVDTIKRLFGEDSLSYGV